jgi:ATP-dependent Clp protease protease subunit
MKTKKFWNWKTRTAVNQETQEPVTERTLFLSGTIAEESWFDDDVTPQLFRDELNAGSGDITVWINSPGGDCVAAAQIYNMLMDYKGNVTVKIDGIAASAASVMAMAGTKVLMSPVSMMMIHNPATIAFGDHNEMQKAIEMLESVKDSIINAYEIKTSLSRAKLSRLMEAETWMDATKAVELGFADDILQRTDAEDDDAPEPVVEAVMFSRKAMNTALLNKLEAKYRTPASEAEIPAPAETGRSVDDILERLDTISKFM